MQKNIHPKSQPVVFQDVVTGEQFLVASTLETAETVLWTDGLTYPLVKVEISSSSHPVYTGGVESEKASSREEKFYKRYTKRERESLN